MMCHHLVACGGSKCITAPTECRHCEDAVSDPADPGRSGKDQTATVIRD